MIDRDSPKQIFAISIILGAITESIAYRIPDIIQDEILQILFTQPRGCKCGENDEMRENGNSLAYLE